MQDLDILMFTFFDKWEDWEKDGFSQRWAIIADKLRLNDRVRRLIVVNVPTSIAGILANRNGASLAPYAFKFEELSPKLTVVSHTRLLPRERTNPLAFKINGAVHDRHLVSAINEYLTRIGCRNPVLWMSGPLTAKYIGHFGESAVVYDAADDWIAHDIFKDMHGEIEKAYEEIMLKADMVFAVSENLCDLFDSKRAIAHWVPNGVDADRFSLNEGEVPEDVRDLPHPIIGYIGALQSRVDTDALQKLLTELPEASFVFVGPVLEKEHFKEIYSFPNAHFVGFKRPVEVPLYLSSFDLCIMPHIVSDLTRAMDPMKLYEYLAAGKPVVASDLPGMDRMADIISVAGESGQFLKLVREELATDSLEKTRARVAFARQNSWDARIDSMLSLIGAYRSTPEE